MGDHDTQFQNSVYLLPFRSMGIPPPSSDHSPHSAALRAMPLKISNLVLIHREMSICNQKFLNNNAFA